MTNVLKEIQLHLQEHELKEEDISWIGSENGEYAMDWPEFKDKFGDMEYDSGFGAQELVSDLVIVMNDGTYFNRWEYDGSEGWEYNKVPTRKPNSKKYEYINVNQVGEIGWISLGELNKDKPVTCVTCNNLFIDKGYYNGDCFKCNESKRYAFYEKYNRFPEKGELYGEKLNE